MNRLIILYSLIITAVVFASNALAQDVTSTAEFGSVKNFIENAIKALTVLAGTISGGFFTWGGYGYITSAGNPEGLEKSKKTIMYSGIGLSITAAAFVITRIITQLAESNFGR